MATYATGITAKWNSTTLVTFQEVTDLSWSFGGGPAKGRDVIWTDDVGTLTLTCLGEEGISTGNYGLKGTLEVAANGADLTCQAVYEGLSVNYELNGVERYTVTFRLLDG